MKTMARYMFIILLAIALLTAIAGCSHQVFANPSFCPEMIVTQQPHPNAITETPEVSPAHEAEPSDSDVFESDIAQRIILELTKPEYGGRLSGTDGIWQAALYLAETFESIGLTPWYDDSYIITYFNMDLVGNDHRLDFIIDYHGLTNSFSHNIVGVIPGQDRTRAVIVTAHYDAIGGGTGALDNASGVAAILRVAAYLLFFGDKPETDIVFCAFDGEEVGFIGSRFFVPELLERYNELYNINIDCVGLPGVAIAFDVSIWADERDSSLRADFAEILYSAGIPYIDIDGHLTMVSDNIIFTNYGIPTLPLGHETGALIEIIHSEMDVIDVLEISLIEELADAVAMFIIVGQGEMY